MKITRLGSVVARAALPAALAVIGLNGTAAHAATTDAGSVVGWGLNFAGEAPPLVSPPPGTTFIQVAAGNTAGYAVTDTGDIVSWGDNGMGQAPGTILPPAGTKFVQAAGENLAALGLTDAGTVVGWGFNGSGEAPPLVTPPGGTRFTQIAGGGYFGLGVTDTGTIAGWGDNQYGEMPPYSTPPTGTGNKFVEVAAGQVFGAALTDTGNVVTWGSDDCGDVPGVVTPPVGTTFTALSAGAYWGLALTDTGSVYTWGCNFYGQAPGLVNPPAGTKFVQAAGGGYHSLAVTDAGTVVTWGWNDEGQAPGTVNPPAGTKFIEAAGGGYFSLALTAEAAPVDTTPPEVSLSVTPSEVPLGGSATAMFTASDPESGIASTTCPPEFAVDTSVLGTHEISCSATNGAGLTSTATASYTVVDTTPPQVSLSVTPSEVLKGLTATATFTASDPESGIASTSCPPTFAVDTSVPGTHEISCSATNGAGLTSTAYTSYTVISPTQAIENLRSDIVSLNLPRGAENPLTSQLNDATRSISMGHTATAISHLRLFIDHVQALSGNRIPAADAADLIAQANNIIASLEATM